MFNLVLSLSFWKDPIPRVQKVSVGILLSSGVGEKPDDLCVSVDDENMLKITIRLPSAMIPVLQSMQRWLTGAASPEIKEYHSKIQGFFTFLEKFQAKEGDPIYSTTQIALPFIVKPDFNRVVLRWKGTNQVVLFVPLSTPGLNYQKEDDMFVI